MIPARGMLLGVGVALMAAASAGAAGAPADHSLAGSGLLGVRFGASAVTAEARVTARSGTAPKLSATSANCQVDALAVWPGLTLDLSHGKLVGYTLSATRNPGLAQLSTAKGLRVGDTTVTAHRLYGARLHLSYAQAGSYLIDTPQGRIGGYLRPYRYGVEGPNEPQGTLVSVGAGDEGCPAESP